MASSYQATCIGGDKARLTLNKAKSLQNMLAGDPVDPLTCQTHSFQVWEVSE